MKFLLREGEQLTLLFYGGLGGGKNQKGTILDIGNALKVELKPEKISTPDKILTVKEYSLIFRPENIRYDIKAFYLLCFFCEMITKIAPTAHLLDENRTPSQHEYFRLLSNAIFYLEESVKHKNFNSLNHTFIFLTKLIHESGISPNLVHCLFCENLLSDLPESSNLEFKIMEGGFACAQCSSTTQNNFNLFKHFKEVYQIQYKQYLHLKEDIIQKYNKQLLDYFYSHFNLNNEHFKSVQFLNL
ncbi:MAG: hypothetical protein U0T83_06595 [Bacteriovoracaceae bacterium]